MKISTKARYGLRAVIYLAEQSEEVCSLKEIAQAQGIPFDYLEKIMAELREENLVESYRGSQGGYTLARKPQQIKVGDIIRTLEGTDLIECISEKERCPYSKNCLAKEVWEKLEKELNQALDSINLKDLIS